jgi:2-polyprenyl-6-methoxyphenol hydroxylase-like FAD-dependent oxidoreductase
MSGMGASLALQGAQALSQALAAHGDDVPAGVAAYERDITEVARGYQWSGRKARQYILNRSPFVAATRNALVHFTPDWLIALSARQFFHANQATG